MDNPLQFLDGYKTYCGAVVILIAVLAGYSKVLTPEQMQLLGGIGMSIVAVGLRSALAKQEDKKP